MNDKASKYWVIKLGSLFYAGELLCTPKNERNVKCREFSNDEENSFPFLFKEDADNIAKSFGGVVLTRNIPATIVKKNNTIDSKLYKNNFK